jgi:putative MATE family efflux protein
MSTQTELKKENKMGTKPMLSLILGMSLPAMFSMFVQSLYNVVDSYFVAQLSEKALTAVSLAFPVQMLMISIAIGTAVGLNSLISRRLGEKKQKDADIAATHGIVLAFLSWIVFVILGLFLVKPFIGLFTSDPEIYQMGCDYTQICTIVSVGIFVEANLERIIQATGNMIYPMIFLLVGAVTNIILDPIFIFGLLGVPAMGISGAAVATVAGQVLSAIVALIVCLTKDHEVHISLKGFRFNGAIIRDIYSVGIPAMIMQSIGSVLMAALNGILATFNDTAVAFYGIYYKLQSFVFMPVFGLTQGVMPIMGYNYGAGNKKRLLKCFKIGTIFAVVIMAIGTIIFWVFPTELLRIFKASDQMLEMGVPALRIISLCFLPAAIGILCSTLFQAVGLGKNSLLVSILRQLVVIVPVAYLLSKISLGAVWYSFPIAETVSLLASIWLAWLVYKNRIQNLTPINE